MSSAFGNTLRELGWIFLAGGAGACLRVVLATTLDRWLHVHVPHVGTFVVNMLGCLGIGFASSMLGPGPLRPVILGGLLGGFTTYSAFGLVGWDLWREQKTGWLALQVGGHVIGGIACVWAGVALARAVGIPERLP